MNDYNFGNFVCELREAKGLTQADIASELGVTPAAVSKWENGSSKPRVEVLFRLAEILGVKPEELMAGKRLEETLDAEAVKRINERYEYLCKIDSYATTNVKLKRIAAWIIDWIISGIFTTIIWAIIIFFMLCVNVIASKEVILVVALLITLTYPTFFIFRDLIFKGRSLGKRMLGLTVLDRRTAGKTNWKQRIVRNIFSVLFMQIDAIIMFIRGESIGDTLAHTAVVLKKDIDTFRSHNTKSEEALPIAGSQNEISKINSYKEPSRMTQKNINTLVISLILASVIFSAIILTTYFALLKNETQTAEYQLAYEYLINSQSFEKSGKSEKDIQFNSYSYERSTDSDGNTSYVKEFGFKLGFWQHVTIICHNNGETWYVCEECTKFN